MRAACIRRTRACRRTGTNVNQLQLPPERRNHPTALEDFRDPVSALLATYRAGDLISVRTSGSTGYPRRVIRTASSWVDSFPIVAKLTALQPGSRAWIPGPFTATMNLYAAALVRYVGARVLPEVGSAAAHPTLCCRCVEAVELHRAAAE